MPKQRITEEMVVQAAFEIARESGIEQVLVKNIAARLGCSVQPIYSYCESMDGLRQKLVTRTGRFLSEFVAERVESATDFKGVGLAHLAFARAEPKLFKLYFLRKRSDIHSIADIYELECDSRVAAGLSEAMGIPLERAKAFHVNMVLYNVGISAILATSECNIPTEELTAQLTQAYLAFSELALKG